MPPRHVLGAIVLAFAASALDARAQQRTYAYAPCADGDAVSVWCVEDGGTSLRAAGTVRHPIGTRAPVEIVLHPTGGFAYVVHAPSERQGAAISLHHIDHRTGRLEFRSVVLETKGPLALELAPTGSHAYVVDAERATLRMFWVDPAFGLWRERHAPMPTGRGPCQVLMDPRGEFLFVLNRESCSVSRYRLDELDRPELAGEDVLLNGSRPVEALMDPTGDRMYVSFDTYDVLLSMSIDPRDGGLRTINAAGTGGCPSGLALSPDGGRIFVAERTSDSLSAFDIGADSGQLGARLGPFPAGPSPTHLALASDGRAIWVTGGGHDLRSFLLDGHTAITPGLTRRSIGPFGPLVGLGNEVTTGVAHLAVELREDGALVARPEAPSVAAPAPGGPLGASVLSAKQVFGSLGSCNELVVDPLGTWVLALGRRPGCFALVSVDTRGRLRAPSTAVSVGHELAVAAVAPGGGLIAIATRTPAAIHTYAVLQGAAQHLHSLPLPSAPDALQFDPTGRALFIAHTAADRLTTVALDEAGFMVRTTSVALAGGPGPLALSPAGDVLFVGLQDTPGVVPCDITGRTRELLVRPGLAVEVERAPLRLECLSTGEALLATLGQGSAPVHIDRHPATGALALRAGPLEAVADARAREAGQPAGAATRSIVGGAAPKGSVVRATARCELALPPATATDRSAGRVGTAQSSAAPLTVGPK